LRRQGHFYEIARLPQGQGHDGELRPVLGFGRSDRSRRLRTEGLAVLHAPDTKHLRCRPCRSLGDGKGSLRGGARGRGRDRERADLSAERRRTGASRPGVAQDRGLDGAHGVSEATPRALSAVPSTRALGRLVILPGRANPTGWNFSEPQGRTAVVGWLGSGRRRTRDHRASILHPLTLTRSGVATVASGLTVCCGSI